MLFKPVTLTKAEQLLKTSIKVCEMLKDSKETYEKKIDVIAASDSYKNIHFVENNKVVSLPRQKLIENSNRKYEKEADEL